MKPADLDLHWFQEKVIMQVRQDYGQCYSIYWLIDVPSVNDLTLSVMS